jgi:uncharacterized protein with PQ loop repeat
MEYIGITSSVIISIMFVPQVVHTYKTKNTEGISFHFLSLNVSASILGLIYAIYYNVIPMIIANTSAGLFSISLFLIKVFAKKDEKKVLPTTII